MRRHLLTLCLIIAAFSLVACESIGPMFGSYKNQLESIVGVTVAGTYNIAISKDGKTLVTETWVCTTDGTKLTGCHKEAQRTVSPDVITQPVPVP